MKKLLLLPFLFLSLLVSAQSVDEILAKNIATTGGLDAWSKVNAMRMVAKIKQGPMDIPIEILKAKDGRQLALITFQGSKIYQGVYDGSTLWNTNFQTMKPEKDTQENTDNYRKNLGEFPHEFIGYKERGWKIDLMGKESVDGTMCYKLKLTKTPIMVDGVSTDNIEYCFLEEESGLQIMKESTVQSGPQKGITGYTKLSDYQDVNGLLLPFTISQGAKGSPASNNVTVEKIELNPTLSDADFKMPVEVAAPAPAPAKAADKKEEEKGKKKGKG